MYVGTQRYTNINNFVNVAQLQKLKSNPIAGASAYCGAIDYKKLTVDHDTCFSCLFCLLKEKVSLESYIDSEYLKSEFSSRDIYFNGSIVETILPNMSMIAKYRSFEDFTGVNETKHISPWAAGILEETASKPVRVGLEVAVPNEAFERPGRLDVCSIVDDYLLMFEAKISLEDALTDERFIPQFDKYLSVINDAVSTKKLPYNLVLLIGGKETDLLYPNHPDCTSTVGNLAKRFYDILIEYNIKFMSANSLWLMALGYLKYGNEYSWDIFIRDIFNDHKCIGLVTAGKIMYSNGVLQIQNL